MPDPTYDLSDDLLDAYEYRGDPALAGLRDSDRAALRAMLRYDVAGGFGRQLTAHQNRVAKDGAAFLRHLGFSSRAAANFRAAMLFHDIGKTDANYDPALWRLMDRPSPDQKALQKKHARLGAEEFAVRNETIAGHPHFAARHAITLLHHERGDGRGLEGRPAAALPIFVQVACVVDAYDGDRISRPHQPGRRTRAETLQRMTEPGGKYEGAFAPDLLHRFAAWKGA